MWKIKNRNFMNNLLKVLASAIGFFVMMIIPVSCDSDEATDPTPDFTITGKVFINSYFNDADGAHEAGTEILEFKADGTVVKYSLFCLLAGDYLQMLDRQDTGRYTAVESAVMFAWKDTVEIATIIADGDKPMLRLREDGEFKLSDLSAEGNVKRFARIHTHDMLVPLVKPGDSLLVLTPESRYFVCSDRRSFVLNVDSLSGSHATNNQTVNFRITGIPGDFVMSESSGVIYLMRFGTMGYAPVDKEMADSNPENVVAVLVCDGSAADFTLASPSVVKNFPEGKNIHTRFAKLKPLLY